ncbi:MAG: hypothetical protein CJBNEKGG_03878 [Prosthecobacter sp.]|nr:hypothetical protein [Prosthecobacter sp.]
MPAKKNSSAAAANTAEAAKKQTVLIAVTGLSPAILAETVWVLAKEHEILPDRVVLITTTEGRRILERQLFTSSNDWGGMSVWDALRKELRAPQEKLRIEGYRIMTAQAAINAPAPELDDIRDDKENAAAADFILNQVRTEVQSSDMLIASIAGGRKTMGTLLYAAMSLAARPQDWVTHVIVNDPFDKKLVPDFYFKPAKAIVHKLLDKDGKVVSQHSSRDAVIHLARIPFVPMSNRFKDFAEHEQQGSFLETVSRIARKELNSTPYVANLAFDHDNKSLIIDGTIVIEMENPTHLNLLNWLCLVQDASWLPTQKKISGIFQAAEQFCRKWHGMPVMEGQVHTGWKDTLKAIVPQYKGEVPSWVKKLEARDFTKALARVRKRVPDDHPWRQLPEKTLKLLPLKLVGTKALAAK